MLKLVGCATAITLILFGSSGFANSCRDLLDDKPWSSFEYHWILDPSLDGSALAKLGLSRHLSGGDLESIFEDFATKLYNANLTPAEKHTLQRKIVALKIAVLAEIAEREKINRLKAAHLRAAGGHSQGELEGHLDNGRFE